MNKMKKLLALLLALVMVLALGACTGGDANQNVSSSAADENTVTFPLAESMSFSMWTTMATSNLKIYGDLNDHPVHKELEKRTNVHINFIHPATGSESESFSINLASGDYADVLYTNYHTAGVADLYQKGFIRDLTEGINTYMPHYAALANSDDLLKRDITLDSGERVVLYNIIEPVIMPWYGPVVRGDLLSQIGKDVPETIAEWEDVLAGFKNLGVEIPLFIANNGSTANTFEPAFGVGSRLYRDGDQVKYGPAEPGYRDYVETMRNWYANGLIDQEFTGNVDWTASIGIATDADFVTGKVGASNMMSHALGDQYVKSGVSTISELYAVGVKDAVMNKGDKVDFSKITGSGKNNGGFGISDKCEESKVPVILQYFDLLYTDEYRNLCNYGIEGVSWNYDADGVPQYTDIINSSAYDGVNTFHVYDYALYNFPFWSIDKELIQGRPQELVDMQMNWVTTGTTMGVLPTLTLTEEEQTASISILNDLNTYADEMTAKFILGIESLDNYDAFLNTFVSMGIDKVIAANQAAYDRYLAR